MHIKLLFLKLAFLFSIVLNKSESIKKIISNILDIKNNVDCTDCNKIMHKNMNYFAKNKKNRLERKDGNKMNDEDILYAYYKIISYINDSFVSSEVFFEAQIRKLLESKLFYEIEKVEHTILEKYDFMKNMFHDFIEKIHNILLFAAVEINPQKPVISDLGKIASIFNLEDMNSFSAFVFKESLNYFLDDISLIIIKANNPLSSMKIKLFQENNFMMNFKIDNKKNHEDVENKSNGFLIRIYSDICRYLTVLREDVMKLDGFTSLHEISVLLIDDFLGKYESFFFKKFESNTDLYNIFNMGEQILLRGIRDTKNEINVIYSTEFCSYFRKNLEKLFDLMD